MIVLAFVFEQTGSKQNICQEKNASKTLNTIHMSLSQTDDVKLNRTQNPWVPTTVTKSTKVDVKNEEEFKSEVNMLCALQSLHIL